MKKKYFFTIIIFLLLVNDSSLKAQVNLQDSLALVNIYDSTNGLKWVVQYNWKTSTPLSKWYGVTVTKGRVTALNFYFANQYPYSGFGLKGRLPYSIGNLTELVTLNCKYDSLYGSIPSSIGNLSKLVTLDLSNNSFNDSIPTSLGNLTNLINLDLSYNSFSGNIPAFLGNMSSIQNLSMIRNQFTGNIPESIYLLSNLKVLELSNNYLSGTISSAIGNLKKLYLLNLCHNNFIGKIPSTLDSLSLLTSLSLNNCMFNDSIPQLGNLINLTYLALGCNNFKKNTIPISFAKLTSLNTLLLDNDSLVGFIPDFLGNLPKLSTLQLNNNRLTGSIPTSFGNLNLLYWLDLSNNKLKDSIPLNLINSNNLVEFDIDSNSFNFNAIEAIINNNPKLNHSNFIQFNQFVLPINNLNGKLSVSVGGTPSKTIYNWYCDNSLVATKKGDSAYIPTKNGYYSVIALDSVSLQVVSLTSDTLRINTILPINLIDFFPKSVNNHEVVLNWITSTEINNRNFIIQRCSNDSSFIDIGNKKAVGSGSNLYAFTDINPNYGINYYRLECLDEEGKIDFSKVITVSIDKYQLPISIYPNPAKDIININFNKMVEKTTITVYDNTGKAVIKQLVNDITKTYKLDIQSLTNGVYWINLNTGTANYNEKLIINK